MSNLEELAARYLDAVLAAKDAAREAKSLKDQLDAMMEPDEEVSVRGAWYVWSVSVGRSPKYADQLAWLHENCTPDVAVLIEESRDAFTGTRVTKSLKPAV